MNSYIIRGRNLQKNASFSQYFSQKLLNFGLNELEKITQALIEDNFEIQISEAFDLHNILSQQIVYLMTYQMEKLLSILYRIDVSEQKVKMAFNQNDPSKIAPELAHLIIERIKQKAETRILYRKKS